MFKIGDRVRLTDTAYVRMLLVPAGYRTDMGRAFHNRTGAIVNRVEPEPVWNVSFFVELTLRYEWFWTDELELTSEL